MKLSFTLQMSPVLKLKSKVMLMNNSVLVDVLAPHYTLEISCKKINGWSLLGDINTLNNNVVLNIERDCMCQ